MNVIIVGCGRVGAMLARCLVDEGHQVTIIDMNQDSFSRLGDDFKGRMKLGTGIDEDVLRRAGIEHADAFVSATNRDNTNIMAAEIAREIFHVPKVVARIYDPGRSDIYKELGLETVSPTAIGVGQFREALMADSHC